MWDPRQYALFAAPRSRPFTDLLARVDAPAPDLVVDLGCGDGSLTLGLADRWPMARVVGVDSSAEMLAAARAHDPAGSVDWVEARQNELVDKVLSIASSQQVALARSSQDRITATVVPLTRQIEHITASRTSQLAAGAAMLAAAVTVGAWGSVTADRLLTKRRAAATAKSPRVSGPVQAGATS